MGHSRDKPGATSARGVGEFYFNAQLDAQLAKVLVETLYAAGFKQAFMINAEGSDITLADRAKMAGRKQAGLFISIHHDSVQPLYLTDWSYQGKRAVAAFYENRLSLQSPFPSQQ